ncbi:MAG: peptidylprolyl isomerase [Acidobacteria bacterium]|nr:peptidylprolyl isomerase [Acidobacteriota bacterium]
MKRRPVSKFVEPVIGEKRQWLLMVLCLSACLCAAACGGGQTQTKDYDADDQTVNANVKKGVKPQADSEAAVIDTEFGQIVIELYPNVAPQMVERFKKLAGEGFYNGTTFHRVNPMTGVVQGGDPNSKDDDPSNDGMGSSPYPNVPAEFSDIPFERGTVGAARAGALDSANCQFYITLHRVAQWDGQYTVFGKVIKGMDNADVISTAPTRAGSENPDPKIVIKSVTLQPRASFGQ